MNKSKEEVLKGIEKYMPKVLVGPGALRLMMLSLDIERRRREEADKAYTRCEKVYEEHQKYARLVKQVTKEES